ncbi:GNAT family N-acetyltransferase [Streptomyces sp. NPDC001903]|uniref:GNAT family N-acetyltransferase n=1 Tax=Streptomyces sp. NPDC001903 TaxID=3364622 RepID=UPI0036956EB6
MSVAEGSGVPEERPGLRIRRRAEDDVEACLRVLAEVHRHDGYPLNWPAQPGAWLSDGPLLGSWVAELDGRPVGHISLSHAAAGDSAPALWSGRTGAPREAAAVVTRLFVSPDARGHSLGALLVGRAVEEAQRHGLHPVLDVLSGDAAAAALYERLGWELMDTVEQQWSPQQTVYVRCYAAPLAARWASASARVSQKDGTRPVHL